MGIKERIKRSVKAFLFDNESRASTDITSRTETLTSSEYWTKHNVTGHYQFKSREESLSYMRWRFSQYLNYEELMPCTGFDNKVVLDYGCGPGHDVIGFVEYSKPARVIAMDVSSSSLDETRKRVGLHNASGIVEVKLIKEKEKLPLEDNSIDYIHSSGVLHHTPNMNEILDEFRRILKPNGIIRIMVYNYNSIWTHLYVPYILQITKGVNKDLSLEDAFRRSTDGDACPISKCYSPEEFLEICNRSNLRGKFSGAAVSLDELDWVNTKNKAMADMRLAERHRDFLKSITFDQYLRPIYKGNIAGIDAVYELHK